MHYPRQAFVTWQTPAIALNLSAHYYAGGLMQDDDGGIAAFDGVAAPLASLTGVTVAVGVTVESGVLDDELLGTRVSYCFCMTVPCTVNEFVASIRLILVLVAAYCMAANTPLDASVCSALVVQVVINAESLFFPSFWIVSGA